MKILIGYDGSPSADAAIEDLQRAGLPREGEARVVCVAEHGLLHHHPSGKSSGDSAGISQHSEAQSLAEAAAMRIQSQFPQWKVDSEALSGSVANVILDTAASWRPDLIIVGSHGRSRVGRLLLGSVSLELVHHAPCSVRVVRTRTALAAAGPIRIVIANDGSTEAGDVVRSVVARVWPPRTEARVISVVQTLVPAPIGIEASTFAHEAAFEVVQKADEQERMRLHDVAENSADALRQAGLVPAFSVIDNGFPGKTIVAEAERSDVDAIFIGDRGLGRLERVMLGSVSTHVLTHAHCAVEVVRQHS